MKHPDLTDDERAIWRAAYAAAFVADFDRNGGEEDFFDRAAKATNAERAIALADLAVERLREWRRDEKPLAGVEFDPYPGLNEDE